MSYQEKLSPWVVYKLLPNLQQAIVARFRNRNDAEAYLKLVSRMIPAASFAIAFERPEPSAPPVEPPAKPPRARSARSKVSVSPT